MAPPRSEYLQQQSLPQLWLLLPLVVGMVVGHRAYFFLTPYSHHLLSACIVFALVAVTLHLIRRTALRFVATVCFVLAIATAGTLLMLTDIARVETLWPNEPNHYAVRIVSLPKSSARSWGVEAEIERGEYAGKHVMLYFPDSVQPQTGERRQVWARIEPPRSSGNPYAFDFAAYLLTQRISGTAYVPRSVVLPPDTAFSLAAWALRLQSSASERLRRHFAGNDFAMLGAMTVGDKRALTATLREVFQDTGTSHLLALSGLHLGILFGLFQLLLLNRLRRRPLRVVAVGFGLALVWLYVLVAAMPVSLIRAATMLSLAQLMLLSRRDTSGLDRLLVAAILLLIVSPLSLLDLGFQLSFLSVAAILTLAPLCPTLPPERNRLLRYLYASIVVSLAAWIGTLPVVAYHFHVIALYSLPANLIVIALATPLLALCAAFFLLPHCESLFVPAIKGVLQAINASLHTIAQLPGSTLSLYPTGLGTLLSLALIVLVVLWRIHRTKPFAIIAIAVFCSLVAVESYAHRPARLQSQLVFYNLWRGSAVQAIGADGRSYLWTRGAGTYDDVCRLEREFFLQENIRQPLPLDSAYRDSLICFAPPLVAFGGKRVALLAEKQSRDTLPTVPVDYLLVARGYSGRPAATLRRFPRATVVLDASLGTVYRQLFHQAADSLHQPCHDIKQQGALIVPLTSAAAQKQ